jgi:multiple sugar transport system substrate-binding protein
MDLPNTPPPPPPAPVSAAPVTPIVAKAPSGFPMKKIMLVLGSVVFLIIVGLVGWKFFAGKQAGPVTITYWGLWESDQIVRPLIEAYQTEHPNVKIDYKYQSPREYRERLQSALSSGSGPDIFKIHSSWVPMFKQDLSPIPAEVYSASEFESTFYPSAKADLLLGRL